MSNHHWVSLGAAFFAFLFVLPFLTNNTLFWSVIVFIASYAFLDVGHSRNFKAKPYLRGLDTALITGHCSGIAIEFAKLFARDGFNLVLALKGIQESTRNELAQLNPAIRIHLIDDWNSKQLFRDLTTDATELKRTFRITQLVNCGSSSLLNGEFFDYNEDDISSLVKENNQNIIENCYLFGKYFMQQKQRNPRLEYQILNVSSVSAFSTAPYYSIYNASRAFIQSFSVSLHEELQAMGVHVSCLCKTDSFLLRQENQTANDADAAKIGYRAMFTNKRYAVAGYLNYSLAILFMYLPYWLNSYVNQFIYGVGVSEVRPLLVPEVHEIQTMKTTTTSVEKENIMRQKLEGDTFGDLTPAQELSTSTAY